MFPSTHPPTFPVCRIMRVSMCVCSNISRETDQVNQAPAVGDPNPLLPSFWQNSQLQSPCLIFSSFSLHCHKLTAASCICCFLQNSLCH